MYPDWPDSAADLVPLPKCDGPKLKPFDFQGPQNLEFLEHIGEGLHAHVFKVKINGLIYALKLFRFTSCVDWDGPSVPTDDLEAMSAFHNYAEPFNCECRAFGRLQEAGHTELAVKCFGYLLLSEESERAMMNKFSNQLPCHLNFNGSGDLPIGEHREAYLGKDGKHPPIRGILKEIGQNNDFRTGKMRGVLQDMTRLQQLGIINLDIAHRQLINWKISDFSTAITTPHFVTTPELIPHLTPEWKARMEYETFMYSLNDYWEFDDMLRTWNYELENPKGEISIRAFPRGHNCSFPIKYNLRSGPSREKLYTYVDPRVYDWRSSLSSRAEKDAKKAIGGRNPDPKVKLAGHAKRGKEISMARRRVLKSKPPKWYCALASGKLGTEYGPDFSPSLGWEFRDHHIIPRELPTSDESRLFYI